MSNEEIKQLLNRVADKLEERGIEPSSDIENLRVLAFSFK